jgi:hypothetical protein
VRVHVRCKLLSCVCVCVCLRVLGCVWVRVVVGGWGGRPTHLDHLGLQVRHIAVRNVQLPFDLLLQLLQLELLLRLLPLHLCGATCRVLQLLLLLPQLQHLVLHAIMRPPQLPPQRRHAVARAPLGVPREVRGLLARAFKAGRHGRRGRHGLVGGSG